MIVGRICEAGLARSIQEAESTDYELAQEIIEGRALERAYHLHEEEPGRFENDPAMQELYDLLVASQLPGATLSDALAELEERRAAHNRRIAARVAAEAEAEKAREQRGKRRRNRDHPQGDRSGV